MSPRWSSAFPVVNDSDVEGTETFGFNVLAGAGYVLGSPSAVNVTVTDNDVLPTVSVSSTGGSRQDQSRWS